MKFCQKVNLEYPSIKLEVAYKYICMYVRSWNVIVERDGFLPIFASCHVFYLSGKIFALFGKVPCWKGALITSLTKTIKPITSSDLNIHSYLLSKILEKVVEKQIPSCLDANSIYPCQRSGFHSRYSRATVLSHTYYN